MSPRDIAPVFFWGGTHEIHNNGTGLTRGIHRSESGPPLLEVLERPEPSLVACALGTGHSKEVKLRGFIANFPSYRREMVARAQGETRGSNIKGLPHTWRGMYKQVVIHVGYTNCKAGTQKIHKKTFWETH